MKRFISVFLILMLVVCCMLSGCSSNKEDYYVSLRLIDEVRDQYDNVLQRTYYNEEADEYLIKEYTYCLQKNKWVCVDQKTTIYKTTYDRPENPVDNSLTIYYNNDLTYEEWDSIPYGEDVPEPRKTLWVCEHCLMGIESHEGNQATLRHSVDEMDAIESRCDWCKQVGFSTLHELI